MRVFEDRNIQHQQQRLVDISRGASEDIEDIEIDLQRRIEDIERNLERDLASLSGTRRSQRVKGVLSYGERAEQAIEDARINAATRRRDDIETERLRDVSELRNG